MSYRWRARLGAQAALTPAVRQPGAPQVSAACSAVSHKLDPPECPLAPDASCEWNQMTRGLRVWLLSLAGLSAGSGLLPSVSEWWGGSNFVVTDVEVLVACEHVCGFLVGLPLISLEGARELGCRVDGTAVWPFSAADPCFPFFPVASECCRGRWAPCSISDPLPDPTGLSQEAETTASQPGSCRSVLCAGPTGSAVTVSPSLPVLAATQGDLSDLQELFQETSANVFRINSNGASVPVRWTWATKCTAGD